MSESAIDMDIMTVDDLIGKYLTFLIGEKVYGVELQNVLEIISVQTVTTVPSTPAFVKGITNLRGRIVPVIDVRLKLNMEERPYDDRTCIIVLNFEDMYIGLIVDEVSEVVTLDNDNMSSLPDIGTVNANQYIQSVSRVKDKLVINLDCHKFIMDDMSSGHY